MSGFNRFFTEAEESALLQTVKRVDCVYAKRDYYWMEFLRATSIRVSTLSKLTVWDANRSLKTERLVMRAEILKGKRNHHDLPLNKRALRALKGLLSVRKKITQSWGDRVDDLPLIVSRNHKGLSVRSFQNRMQKWIEQAGLEAGTPHFWRHTWAKRALKNSSNPDYALVSIQKVLGHTNIQTTTIYTQPDKTDLEDIMRDSE